MTGFNLSGIGAGIGITLLGAGWVVASQLGLRIDLSVYDLLALRLLVACLICIPVLLWLGSWRGLSFRQYLVLGLLGGIPHSLLSYLAMERTSVAQFSVFLYGTTPIATALVGYLLLRKKVSSKQLIGSLIIMLGIVALSFDDFIGGMDAVAWSGNLMAFAAITLFAGYMVFAERWKVSISQSISACTVLNGLIYLPVWFITTDTRFAGVEMTDLIVQGLIQGLIPGVLVLLVATIATRSIGADYTALFFALTPVASATLAVLVLNEQMTTAIMLGVFLTTVGIMAATFRLRRNPATAAFAD